MFTYSCPEIIYSTSSPVILYEHHSQSSTQCHSEMSPMLSSSGCSPLFVQTSNGQIKHENATGFKSQSLVIPKTLCVMPRSKAIAKRNAQRKALIRTSSGQLMLIKKASQKSDRSIGQKKNAPRKTGSSEIQTDENCEQMRMAQQTALYQHQIQLQQQKTLQQRVEYFDLVEDLFQIYEVFRLSLSTLFLAISIIQRAFLVSTSEFMPCLESLNEIEQLSNRDKSKIAVYVSMSLAAKYNDRIAFKFDEFSQALRFESDLVNVRAVLTNEKLRLIEYEILNKLNFKIGDSTEASQISRGHEILLKVFPSAGSQQTEVTNQVRSASLLFAKLTLISKSALVFSTDEIALGSAFMALKLYERKSGQSELITKDLFNNILTSVAPEGQFSQYESKVLHCATHIMDTLKSLQSPLFKMNQGGRWPTIGAQVRRVMHEQFVKQ